MASCHRRTDDIEPWILSNPADHLSVQRLELTYDLETIGDSIGILSKLTHLYISNRDLKCLPSSILSLHNLQRLELKKCYKLQDLPHNLGDLKSLTCLFLEDCFHIKSLTNSIVNLSNLITLRLYDCTNLTELPAISSVVDLRLLACISIQSLPQGLCNLELLRLAYCKSLTELPPDLTVPHLGIIGCCGIQSLPEGLCNLEHLDLSLCFEQIQLLSDLSHFENLRHLTLLKCAWHKHDFDELPASLGELFELLYLNIQDTTIKWLPWSITNLSNLNLLLLPRNFRLETLPEHLNDSIVISVGLTHVRKTWKELKTELNLFSVPILQLEEAHDLSTPGYLQHTGDPGALFREDLQIFVRILDLNLDDNNGCHMNIMNLIGQLPFLTHLYISFQYLCHLPLTFMRITLLSLSDCYFKRDIVSCPEFDSLAKLSTLQSLKLFQCEFLPAHIDLPISLTHLALESYEYELLPESYVATMRKLYNLSTLELSGFGYFGLSLLNLNLAKLKMKNCYIESLPTGLQHLEIIHFKVEWHECCNNLQVCLKQLINLKTLSVTCHNIEVLPSIERHQNLQELQLKDCFNLKKLPPNLNELVELCTLNVSGTRIKSLPESITKLQNLQHVIIPKCFILETLPKNFENKVRVSTDVTDEEYYQQVGYYDSCYNSKENNESMSGSIEGADQAVLQESNHNIITEEASPSRPLNPPPDVAQVHEGSHFGCRTDTTDSVLFNSQNPEVQNLPKGTDDLVVPLENNDISDYNETDGHQFTNEISQVHADPEELEGAPFNQRIDAGGESSSHALYSIQNQEIKILPSRNSDCAYDLAAISTPNVHDSGYSGEINQQGFQNAQINTINLDSINLVQSVDVKHKKIQKKQIPEERIRQCMSENVTLEDAAIQLSISRSTMKRRLKECGITWSTNRKKKQHHQDAKNKEHTTMSSSIENSSQLSLVNPTNLTGHENRAEHIGGSCSTFDVKATYKEDTVRIYNMLALSSSIDQLKEKVAEKLGLEVGKFKMKFLDEHNDWILMSCNSDLEHALQITKSSGINVVKLSVSSEI